MMDVILYLYHEADKLVDQGIAFRMITQTDIFGKLTKMKYEVPNDDLDMFDDYYDLVDNALSDIN
jgi:V/A-type H+-transporting ATPase subunit A